jgi:hypothetical protein
VITSICDPIFFQLDGRILFSGPREKATSPLKKTLLPPPKTSEAKIKPKKLSICILQLYVNTLFQINTHTHSRYLRFYLKICYDQKYPFFFRACAFIGTKFDRFSPPRIRICSVVRVSGRVRKAVESKAAWRAHTYYVMCTYNLHYAVIHVFTMFQYSKINQIFTLCVPPSLFIGDFHIANPPRGPGYYR